MFGFSEKETLYLQPEEALYLNEIVSYTHTDMYTHTHTCKHILYVCVYACVHRHKQIPTTYTYIMYMHMQYMQHIYTPTDTHKLSHFP